MVEKQELTDPQSSVYPKQNKHKQKATLAHQRKKKLLKSKDKEKIFKTVWEKNNTLYTSNKVYMKD